MKLVGNVQGDGRESLRILDDNGVKEVEYFWYTADGYFGEEGYESGWYTAGEELVDSVTFTRGKGLYLYINHSKNVSLQSSGNVAVKCYRIKLEQGVNVTGNATPIALDLQKIKLDANAAGDGRESLRILDANGVKEEEYFWYTADGYFGEEGYEAGWYTAGEEFVQDVEIQPGQGLYIYKSSPKEVKLILPTPISNN